MKNLNCLVFTAKNLKNFDTVSVYEHTSVVLRWLKKVSLLLKGSEFPHDLHDWFATKIAAALTMAIPQNILFS